MKVLTIMHNGFEELEAIGTLALLRRAGIECDITSFEGDKCPRLRNSFDTWNHQK